MPKVASNFGKVLGTRNKMPNPKLGAIFPPRANISPIVDKFKNSVRLRSKDVSVGQVLIGKRSFDNEALAENILAIYNHIIHHLPYEKNNIKSILIKTTMGKAIKLDY
jgi:large subunit ribosomal protein L1